MRTALGGDSTSCVSAGSIVSLEYGSREYYDNTGEIVIRAEGKAVSEESLLLLLPPRRHSHSPLASFSCYEVSGVQNTIRGNKRAIRYRCKVQRIDLTRHCLVQLAV